MGDNVTTTLGFDIIVSGIKDYQFQGNIVISNMNKQAFNINSKCNRTIMPHIIVKMYSGRSDTQKKQLAEEITRAVMKVTGNQEKSVSVSIEDI